MTFRFFNRASAIDRTQRLYSDLQTDPAFTALRERADFKALFVPR